MRWGLVLVIFFAAPALAQPSADQRDRQSMISESIRNYPGNCPCPYNTDRAGRSCGQRSAYSKPGGAAPFCYPADITDAMLERWGARQRWATGAGGGESLDPFRADRIVALD